MTADEIIKAILKAYDTCGELDYGENISMKEHMLQSACLAEKNGCSDQVIVASLLHDFGHLVSNMPNDIFERGEDNYHQSAGARALEAWFPQELVNAGRLHVDAKRYLCRVKPAYINKLSEASKMTLKVQGGPMNEREVKNFEAQPGYKMALQVRVYDDLGKEEFMERPELDYYIPKLKACLK